MNEYINRLVLDMSDIDTILEKKNFSFVSLFPICFNI